MFLNYDQEFIFNGQKLSGISDVSFNAGLGVALAKTLGAKNYGFYKDGPALGVLEFSRSLIYNDPVFSLTGNSPCSGQFSYGSIDYFFNSGYLNNYSVSCSVGQIPAVSANFQIYGEMKSGDISPTVSAHPDIHVPSPRSIVIQNDYSSSNRATSLQYSVECQRIPRYDFNSLFPTEISSISPVKISAAISFNVKGFSPIDLQNFVRQVSSPTFNISIKDRTLSTTLMTLPVTNATLTSQQIQGTVDSPIGVTLQYEGYSE